MLFLSLAESHIVLPQGKLGRKGINQAKKGNGKRHNIEEQLVIWKKMQVI